MKQSGVVASKCCWPHSLTLSLSLFFSFSSVVLVPESLGLVVYDAFYKKQNFTKKSFLSLSLSFKLSSFIFRDFTFSIVLSLFFVDSTHDDNIFLYDSHLNSIYNSGQQLNNQDIRTTRTNLENHKTVNEFGLCIYVMYVCVRKNRKKC